MSKKLSRRETLKLGWVGSLAMLFGGLIGKLPKVFRVSKPKSMILDNMGFSSNDTFYYVDPKNGKPSNKGTGPDDAVKSIAQALEVRDKDQDIVYLVRDNNLPQEFTDNTHYIGVD